MSEHAGDAPQQLSTESKRHPHSVSNRAVRVLWGLVQASLFRFSPRPLYPWRAMLVRLFGADVPMSARIAPRATIWGPWNLTMGERATIADGVDCYCVARVTIGARTTVSQYTYLCAATHDFEDPAFVLQPKPITIGSDCWIAADVFVGPGVTIGDGAVVGARSAVFADLPAWKVCSGTPAKPGRDRVLRGTRCAGSDAETAERENTRSDSG